jgi:tetratricopeptide (TPR) repeat protein
MGSMAPERVELLLRLDRPTEAEAAARELIGENPDWFAGYFYLAAALAALDRPTEALAASDAVLARSPGFSPAHAQRSRLLLALDRVAEAEVAARTAVRLDPADPNGYVRLADALITADRWSEAKAVITDARGQFPDHADVLHQAGVLAVFEGHTEHLAAVARAGLALDAADARFHLFAGLAKAQQARQVPEGSERQQRYQDAERLLAEAVRLWPTQAVYRTLRKRNAADSRDDAMATLMAWWLLAVFVGGLFMPIVLGRPRAPWWVWVPATAGLGVAAVLSDVLVPEFSLVAPLWRKDVVTIPLMPEERRKGRVLWALFLALTVAVLFLPTLLLGR